MRAVFWSRSVPARVAARVAGSQAGRGARQARKARMAASTAARTLVSATVRRSAEVVDATEVEVSAMLEGVEDDEPSPAVVDAADVAAETGDVVLAGGVELFDEHALRHA